MTIVKFSSTMTKFQPIIKKENVIVCFQFKVVEETSIRTFPQQFRGQIDLMSVFSTNATQDVWSKMNIPVSDYRMNYNITFGDKTFKGKLEQIDAVRKENSDGTWKTEYTLTFVKELENDLDTNLSSMLKYKAVDPESGKKQLVLFDTTLEEEV